MANPLFNEQMQTGMMSQFNSFMQNPLQYLTQRKINIPQQFQNDPHGAVDYLIKNGQMSQSQLNNLMQRAQQMGIKF